jgi:transcriptional regulator with GAF, ATPase, and Fis domain
MAVALGVYGEIFSAVVLVPPGSALIPVRSRSMRPMNTAWTPFHAAAGGAAEGERWPRLDRLATELSSALIRLDGDQMVRALEDTARQVVEVLDIDRCGLTLYAEDGSAPKELCAWTRPGVRTVSLEEPLQAPWYMGCQSRCEAVALHRIPDDLPPEAGSDLTYFKRAMVKSQLALPVAIGGQVICVLTASAYRAPRPWPEPVVGRLRHLVEIVGWALHRDRQTAALREARAELSRLTGRIGSENKYLREAIDDLHGFDEIVGESPALRASLARVTEVAPTDASVLLLGDTGTGKELFARALHERSPRRQRPLVSVNCAALPATLIESELFGHERGAFTGAVAARQGRFELADHGTLFLDEIGDLPLDLQAKLLRVLQEGEFERLGSSHKRKVDVRLIAATHRDLGAMAADGRFRSDLYYRLNVFPIRIPTLRERRDDIPRLVWYIIHRRQRALRRAITQVPAAVMERLQGFDWPGNVRELENVIERAMIRSTGDTLILHEGLEMGGRQPSPLDRTTLSGVERQHIENVLHSCNWRINGAGNAAEQLGLHPNTLRFRMKKLVIVRPPRQAPPGS